MIYAIFLLAGLMFGVGLTISGMINPTKILDFLDFAAIPSGGWDPSLAFVFASGLVPISVAFWIRRRMMSPIVADKFLIPTNDTIDRPLVLGSAIFGIGWGLAGLCPGPAISGLAFGKFESILFVVAMFAGILLKRQLGRAEPVKSEVGSAA